MHLLNLLTSNAKEPKIGEILCIAQIMTGLNDFSIKLLVTKKKNYRIFAPQLVEILNYHFRFYFLITRLFFLYGVSSGNALFRRYRVA